jgi:Thioesterase-like superfamily
LTARIASGGGDCATGGIGSTVSADGRGAGFRVILRHGSGARGRAMEAVLETVVRCIEIDVNGHVNNARYVEYLEWGREAWYEAHGFPYARLLALGAITVVANLNLNLRARATRGTGCGSSPGRSGGAAAASPWRSGSNGATAWWQPTRSSPWSRSIPPPAGPGRCPRSSPASSRPRPEPPPPRASLGPARAALGEDGLVLTPATSLASVTSAAGGHTVQTGARWCVTTLFHFPATRRRICRSVSE